MNLIVEKIKTSGSNKRFDVQLVEVTGLFEEDRRFDLRIMSYQPVELSKKETQALAKQMLSNESDWIRSKKFFVYNYTDGKTGYIPISAWENSGGA